MYGRRYVHHQEGTCQTEDGDGYDQGFPFQGCWTYEDDVLEHIDCQDDNDYLEQRGLLSSLMLLIRSQLGRFASVLSVELLMNRL